MYDLVDLRVATSCLPDRFDMDEDGRKAVSRAAFLQSVLRLVGQVESYSNSC